MRKEMWMGNIHQHAGCSRGCSRVYVCTSGKVLLALLSSPPARRQPALLLEKVEWDRRSLTTLHGF